MILTPLSTRPAWIRSLVFLLAVLLCGAARSEPLPANGRTPEREIQAGETQIYEIPLEAGQFLRVQAPQDGSDLILRLVDSQGNLVAIADSLEWGKARSREELAMVSAHEGLYQLQVVAGEGKAFRYRLEIDGPRSPTAMDHARAEASEATFHGLIEPGKADAPTRIQILERARDLWRQLDETGKEAEALFALGLVHGSLSDHELAAALYREAAERWALTNRLCQAQALARTGRALRKAGKLEEARPILLLAVQLAEAEGDVDLQADVLEQLGLIATDLGEILLSLELQKEALRFAKLGKSRNVESVFLSNLAGTYSQIGEAQKALAYYQQALDLAKANPSGDSALLFQNNVADMYRTLGDWAKAFELLKECEELSRTEVRPDLRASILINLAYTSRYFGDIARARALLEEALELGKKNNLLEVQCFGRMNLSALELEERNASRAAEHAREAVALATTPLREMLARYALGRALRELGEPAAAQAELERALALSAKFATGGNEEIRIALARVKRDQGDFEAARSLLQTAIDRLETWRKGVVSPELRSTFLAYKQDYFELQIDTLMALHVAHPEGGFSADALRMSERARARGLLEILEEADSGLRTSTSPDLQAREQRAREELSFRDYYRRELLNSGERDEKKLAEADQKLRDALDLFEKVQVEIRESNPRFRALTDPQTLTVQEIQQQVLDGNALLLEFFLGTERSFLFAIGPASLVAYELPARARIEEAARKYYELLTVRNNRLPGETPLAWKKRIAQADQDAHQAGRDLAEMVLRPVASLLGDRPLLVVSDGALQYIPFGALEWPTLGEPLIQRHEIVSLPSASAFSVIRREARERTRAAHPLAVFADPVFERGDGRMPVTSPEDKAKPADEISTRSQLSDELSRFTRLTFSQKEADAITALVPPGEAFKAIGFDASRHTVETMTLDAYRIVHFATHGVVDSKNPELSGLVLSLFNSRGERQDGFLRLHDIYNLRLNADLVVLSACRTALGKEIRGEGLVGLTRGFLYAGASRVLATLWSVEDRATSELMEAFYRSMFREGLTPGAALRKAQLEMAKSPSHGSPYYWAGFSLQGEWR